MKCFVGGLQDLKVRKHVHMKRPADLNQTINRENTVARAESMAETESRNEPMEIGTMPLANPKSTNTESELISIMKELSMRAP